MLYSCMQHHHFVTTLLLYQAKQHLKAERLEEELTEGKKPEVVDDADSEDEDKYADRIDMPGQKFDTKR